MSIPVKIIDNFLPEFLAREIENTLLSSNFPWYYVNDISLPTNDDVADKDTDYKSPYGLTHWYWYNDEGQNSPYYSLVNMIPKFALEHCGMDPVHSVFQCRSFLHLPKQRHEKHDGIHIDTKIPHTVLLYYANDCEEAPTYLFTDETGEEVAMTIKPKRNRLAIFAGDIYHASSQPENSARAIVNFDVIHLEDKKFYD